MLNFSISYYIDFKMVDRALADMRFLERVQSSFAPEDMTQDRLEDWILHSKGVHEVSAGKGKRREVKPQGISTPSRRLAKRLSETSELYVRAQSETEIEELVRLKTEAEDLKVHRGKIEKELDSSIRMAQEVKEAEQRRTEAEARKFMISEFKEAETAEEVLEARRELKRTLPFSLRSIKGWETRRGKEAFRFVFD